MITAVIQTLDDERRLLPTLVALVPAATEGVVREVVVIDHGSRDGTLGVADAAGCSVVDGRQDPYSARRRAAEQARGDWLLFLRPGAVLEPSWLGEAVAFIDGALVDGVARSRAATFRLKRDNARSRSGEWPSALSTRLFAAPRREQGLLIGRAFYLALGGHRPPDGVADMDLARRIGRRRLTLLDAAITVRERDVPSPGRVRGAARLALIAFRVPRRVIGWLAL